MSSASSMTACSSPALHPDRALLPSRASFMTGHYPSRHGVWNNVLHQHAPQRRAQARHPLLLRGPAGGRAMTSPTPGSGMSRRSKRDPADRGWDELLGDLRQGRSTDTRAVSRRWWRRSRARTATPAARRGHALRPGWMNRAAYGSRPDGGPKGYENVHDYQVVRSAIERCPTLARRRCPVDALLRTRRPPRPVHHARALRHHVRRPTGRAAGELL